MSAGTNKKRSYEEFASDSHHTLPSSVAKKRKRDDIWSCDRCTFHNSISDQQCAMCLNPRAEDADNEVPRGDREDAVNRSQPKKAERKSDSNPAHIYVVMTAVHEIGSGSDYFMDSLCKETYDTQIIAVYASRHRANERGKREAFIYEGDPGDSVSRWPKNDDPSLFFHEGEMEDDNPPRCTRVWVEKHTINYR